MKRTDRYLTATGLLAVLFLFLAGCSTKPEDRAPEIRVTGPVAGKAVFYGGQYSLEASGYIQEEYFVAGNAASYRLPDDKSAVQRAGAANFETRLVLIRPKDAQRFNGTVVVEWLNVTSGGDAPAEWLMLHRELLHEGYAYAGVSAQLVGVEGGASLFPGGAPLKKANASRYASLHHPGDAFSYDIFSQAGRAIRGGGTRPVLGGLVPKTLLAVGESQSAQFLATYVNAVDPAARVFDGYLIHSRFVAGAGLDGSPHILDADQPGVAATRTREDSRTPVLTLVTETDVLSPKMMFLRARQPDSANFRLWEVAGAAHADSYLLRTAPLDSGSASIGQLASLLQPMADLGGMPLEPPANAFPGHHYVAQAALHKLNQWARGGAAPPVAARLETTGEGSFALDAHGNVAGGVRTPWVNVPVAQYSGLRKSTQSFESILGGTRIFDRSKLRAVYPGGRQDYLARFEQALREAVQGGFLLGADEAEIKELAAAMCPIP